MIEVKNTTTMMEDPNMTAVDEESLFSDEELFGTGKNIIFNHINAFFCSQKLMYT